MRQFRSHKVDTRKTIDVERLVEWAFRRERAHVVIGSGAGLFDSEAHCDGVTVRRMSSDLAAVQKFAALGCFVDRLGYASGNLPIDAERVHNVITRFPEPQRTLLFRHGCAGTRPDYGGDVDLRLYPVWKGEPRFDARGLPMPGSFRLTWPRSGSKKAPIACPLEPRETIALLENLRADWTAWREGLVALVELFDHEPLERHVVTGPAVPAEPWKRRRREAAA